MEKTLNQNITTKSSTLANNWVRENDQTSLVVENMRQEVWLKKNPLGISWYLFVPPLAMTSVLLVPQARDFFLSVGWRWAHVMLLSFGISFSLNPIFSKIAYKLNMLDHPNQRKLHHEATPLLGGAAVFAGFLAALLINGIFSLELGAILISAMILFGIGVLDDYKEIPAGMKLLTQLICGVLVITCGIVLRVIPLELGLFAYAGNVMLTLFWIIGITNAMNFFDGMDGLAAGLGALIAFFLGVVAFQTAQPFIGWIAVAMMGSCIGFLPYNFKIKGNAKIFLGDAGSTVIGFILACVAVYGDWAEGNTVVALISPLLIFWILIFDMIHITFDRILTGKVLNLRQWIEYVGKDHLHHRLAIVLGGKKKSVLFIYLLSLCLGLSAVALRNARVVDAILLILQASIMVVLITLLERRGRLQNGTLESG
ncbi:Undecaprenyl-phosphate alpha-N-acetylglucosaminyl 1-phosphate transferase (EC [Olavius sp. associated proteobacterium Delta 1]|nr:Undecaprenyl-phosphate alpha-N-acetylglucosaminyl 1-phosphate transferase (EC [Olavius sp. associated proteobacterium Delta 1]